MIASDHDASVLSPPIQYPAPARDLRLLVVCRKSPRQEVLFSRDKVIFTLLGRPGRRRRVFSVLFRGVFLPGLLNGVPLDPPYTLFSDRSSLRITISELLTGQPTPLFNSDRYPPLRDCDVFGYTRLDQMSALSFFPWKSKCCCRFFLMPLSCSDVISLGNMEPFAAWSRCRLVQLPLFCLGMTRLDQLCSHLSLPPPLLRMVGSFSSCYACLVSIPKRPLFHTSCNPPF